MPRSMSLVFPHTFVPWFRAVAPYIHAYRGKTFVVALAGEAIAAGKLNTIVQDLAILHAMGIKLVLVHGFRPQVNEQLRLKGHEAKYSHGMRITDGEGRILAVNAAYCRLVAMPRADPAGRGVPHPAVLATRRSTSACRKAPPLSFGVTPAFLPAPVRRPRRKSSGSALTCAAA
jgi:PAS domain-containing protein